jgi:pentatricopeptide repeat protein
MPELETAAQSQTHKDMQLLSRRVKYAEEAANKWIAAIEVKSDSHLEKREFALSYQERVENARRANVMQNHERKNAFSIEVDSAVKEKLKNRADILYHKKQVELNTPAWFKLVDAVTATAKNSGHNNKSKWRSRCSKQINVAIESAATDKYAAASTSTLRRVVREINTINANQLVEILEGIKLDYIHGMNQTNDPKLGHHSKELTVAEQRRTQHIVPLPSKHWSDSIAGSRSTLDNLTLGKSSRMSGIEDDSFTTLPYGSTIGTASVFEKFNNNLKVPGNTSSGNRLYMPNRTVQHELSYKQELIKMRAAAVDGDFAAAWGVFRKKIDPTGGAITSKINGKPRPLTQEIYRILMMAMKNGNLSNYEDAEKVLSHMDSNGIKPDVVIYNLMIGACVRESQWRRCLLIMRNLDERYGIIPNAQSFEVLLDSCRHSLEEPAVIYETLRSVAHIPHDFCYRASAVNAGNRLSSQALLEQMHDSQLSLPDGTGQAPSYVLGKHYSQPRMVSVKSRTGDMAMRDFHLAVRDSIPLPSPAKYSFGRTAKAFDVQVNRQLHNQGVHMDGLVVQSRAKTMGAGTRMMDSISSFADRTTGTGFKLGETSMSTLNSGDNNSIGFGGHSVTFEDS